MGLRVGIDLGTTFCAIAMIDETTQTATVIPNGLGKQITPSVLYFSPDGTILHGEEAKMMQEAGDANTISFFKRNMGNSNFRVDFHRHTYSAQDLASILLKAVVKEAQTELNQRITDAVITVPAYFTHTQRQATIEAGANAGLNVLAVINEPTAAAVAYGLNKSDSPKTILIYDLGGGTFDVTIAKIQQGRIDIVGSGGDHDLGGKDWDNAIGNYLAQRFEEKHGVSVLDDPMALETMTVAAEQVKKQLSNRSEVMATMSVSGIRDSVLITQEIFEEITEYLLGNTSDVIDRLFLDEKVCLSWKDIDGVILMGGSTRMPMVQRYIRRQLGQEPMMGMDVDEAVAKGAAIWANLPQMEEVINHLPERPQKSEASGALRQTLEIQDVTAHSLGMIAVSEDGKRFVNRSIIPKNSAIPSKEMQPFTFRTQAKNNILEIYVLQGERQRPLDNAVLHQYTVEGIEPMDGGKTRIDVTYSYDYSGVVSVTALQSETGKVLPVLIGDIPEDMSWTDRSPKDKDSTGTLVPLDIVLAVDLSGSMRGNPLAGATTAMSSFVQELDEQFRFGIVGFGDTAHTFLGITDNHDKVIREISQLKTGSCGGGTSGEPFTKAVSMLRRSKLGRKYVVVLTDGQWGNQSDAIQKAKKCHKDGIEVIAIGFGTADKGFLQKIASSKDFATLTDLSGLTSSFSTIAQIIGNQSIGHQSTGNQSAGLKK